ncbi:MAG: glucokinase [Pseudomonadota bacterium]
MSDALLVDLGGTNARLGLARNTVLDPASRHSAANADYPDLTGMLRAYLSDRDAHVQTICAGVAGPVRDGTAQLTNHRWFIDGAALATALGANRTVLLNDLQAQAYALDDLAPSGITPLITATPDPAGPRMVLCLGTGCNIAVAHRVGEALMVPASESGHTTLPDAPEFRALYDDLRTEFPHLPIEAVLSGAGLSRLHHAFTGQTLTPQDIIAAAPTDTLGAFARLLGMASGNLALSHMATGGVYLIGGLARAIAPHLIRHGFHAPFCDRGPYTDIMARMSVHVVTDDSAALLGCARYLRQLGV